jgi:hypothetical protein
MYINSHNLTPCRKAKNPANFNTNLKTDIDLQLYLQRLYLHRKHRKSIIVYLQRIGEFSFSENIQGITNYEMQPSTSGIGRVSASNNRGAAASNAQGATVAATANVRPSTPANEGAMGDLLKQLRETYECPICYGYIMLAGYGKICSSGHRICSICKDVVVETPQPDGTTTRGPMDKCPVCRTFNLRDDNMLDEHFHYEQVAQIIPFKCKEGVLAEGCG